LPLGTKGEAKARRLNLTLLPPAYSSAQTRGQR